MEKVLTIVVPSYNTEKHIDNSLPSLIADSISNKLEILLINDGSTDGTLERIKEFEKNYPNCIRVISKENGGHGSVINRGIKEAKGKYFRVIDGDDAVITENLIKLIENLEQCDSDVVFSPYIMEFVQSGERVECDKYDLESGKEYSFDSLSKIINCIPLHGINYKTTLLKEHDIHVQEHCFYEDKEYIMYPIPFVNTATYYTDPIYIYRIGVPGQSISVEKVVKNWKMLKRITENLCIFYENLGEQVSKEKKQYLSTAICDVIKNTYGMFLKMPYDTKNVNYIKEFSEECQKWSPNLYDDSDKGVIRLLRSNSKIIYAICYVMFRQKMKNRGF